MRIPSYVLCLSLSLAALPTMASAALLVNGGFESPAVASFVNRGGGVGGLTGWTITGGLIQWHSQPFGFTLVVPSEGIQFVTLQSSNNIGSISQTFSTVPGTSYNVTFDLFALAGVNTTPAETLTLNVSADTTVPTTGSFTTTTPANPPSFRTTTPVSETFGFTATGSSTTVTFANQTKYTGDQNFGTSLDNIVATEVPEPTSLGLLGLMSASFVLRRRRRA